MYSLYSIAIHIAVLVLWAILVVLSFLAVRIAIRLKREVFNRGNKVRASREQAVLITGATSGIGLALSKYVARKGFTVIACYYSDKEPGFAELHELNQVATESKTKPFYFVELNVRSRESIKSCYAEVDRLLEQNSLKLRALINNAGISPVSRFQWLRDTTIQACVETNLTGPMLMTRQFLCMLARNPGSRVVNVSSAIQFIPTSFSGLYGATKAGVAYFTNALPIDIGEYPVKVTTIYPGNLMGETAIVANSEPELKSSFEELTEEEKQRYGKDFEKTSRQIVAFQDRIRRKQERKRVQTTSKEKRRRRGLMSYLKQLIDINAGCITRGKKIEDSTFMLPFDNAIRLRNPPKEMFAGNLYFTLVSSSFLSAFSQDVRYAFCRLASRLRIDLI